MDEEKQAVYNIMGILEDLSEVIPEVGAKAMNNSAWRQWVLKRYGTHILVNRHNR